MKIYVAGHRGLVGSAITRAIENSEEHSWIGQTRQELDLSDREAVFAYLASEKPDAIIVAAAKVGGIHANATFPVEFLTENLQIQGNLLDGAHAAGIDRLLFLGSSCIYPKFAAQPITESALLTGALEPTNEPYAIAKIAGLKLVEAYRHEYGHNWISAMPTNLYGPGDNFHPENSHVLPALLRRFHEAKNSKASAVVCWGTGSPMREFLHADDLADACLYLLENYNDSEHVNVGSAREISIRALTELIAEVVGFDGEIQWDESKPDGTPRKLLDTSKLDSLGWQAKIGLRDGLERTYSWYLESLSSHDIS
jgi:GDP-L-fucose synthase